MSIPKPVGSILCLGRNRRNQALLSQVLAKAGYRVEVALTSQDMLSAIEHRAIALALIDISGFDAKIWESCQRLRSRDIPFFVITPSQNAHTPAQYDSNIPLLVKPLAIRSLLTLIAQTLQVHHG